MSPERDSWWDLEKDLSDKVKEAMGGKTKEFRNLLHGGFLLKANGQDVEIIPREEAKASLIKDARKKSSDWILVKGLARSKRAKRKRLSEERIWGGVTLENAMTRVRYKREYRGKHRSHNRGRGMKSLLRQSGKGK